MSQTTIGTRRWLLLALAAAVLAAALALAGSARAANVSQTGFGFNAADVSGFPTGSVFLTGGGAYSPDTGFVHSAGGFRCTTAVGQGPLAGCLQGQGVRWDTAALLPGTSFKCTGALTEALKPAVTDRNTAVLQADFYRAGDGDDESFSAQMIVSRNDLDPDTLGTQNVWVQGVGCGSAAVHFSSPS